MEQKSDLTSKDYINRIIKSNRVRVTDVDIEFDAVVLRLQQCIDQLDVQGRTKIISVVGGAASGKSTLASKLIENYSSSETLCTDAFSLGTRSYRANLQEKNPFLKYNFDLLVKIKEQIVASRQKRVIIVPVYDELSGAGVPLNSTLTSIASTQDVFKTKKINCPIDLLLIEGDFQPIKDSDLIIYLHLDDEIRLQNRIQRDINHRGATSIQAIKDSFNSRQHLQHLPYTLQIASNADVLVCSKLSHDSSIYTYDIYKQVLII